VQFTQDQARSLVGISAETLRYWRRVVPYLASKPGKPARFSFADLVALAATREAVGSLGLRISRISLGVDALFRLFAEAPWHSLDGAVAALSPKAAELHYWDDVSRMGLAGPTILIPCGPMVQRLRDELLPSAATEVQQYLPFPPQSVRSASQ